LLPCLFCSRPNFAAARATEPEPELKLLLNKLKLDLPAQPRPKITLATTQPAVVPTFGDSL
jgi:hypothetical protein